MKKFVSMILAAGLVLSLGSCAVSKGPLADPAYSKVNYESTNKDSSKVSTTKAAESAVQIFTKGWGFIQNTVAAEENEEVKYTFLDFDGDGVPELVACKKDKNHYFKADVRANQVLYLETDAESEYVPNWASTENHVRLLKNLETQNNVYFVCDEKNGNNIAYTNYFVFVGYEDGKFSLNPIFKIIHGRDEDGNDVATDHFIFQEWGFEPFDKEYYEETLSKLDRDFTDLNLKYAIFSSKDFDPENLTELTDTIQKSYEAFRMG